MDPLDELLAEAGIPTDHPTRTLVERDGHRVVTDQPPWLEDLSPPTVDEILAAQERIDQAVQVCTDRTIEMQRTRLVHTGPQRVWINGVELTAHVQRIDVDLDE